MNKQELEEWEQDHKDNRLSSGAYILYLRLYITELESRTCGNCKYWSWANKEKTLKKCLGDNGCVITGDKFYCSNWESK